MKLNENYFNLKENYLFAEVAHRVSEYRAAHPEQRIISLGICLLYTSDAADE